MLYVERPRIKGGVLIDEDSVVQIALLSWARGHYTLSRDNNQKEAMTKMFKILEDYLLGSGISDLALINKTDDYYTISYTKNNLTRIIKFLVEDVEKYL